MKLELRWLIEKEHHNREAKVLLSSGRRKEFIQEDDHPLSSLKNFPDIENMFMEGLGNVRGKRVLELGCGRGDLSILLARMGAYVTAIDISEEYVQIVQRRAVLNGVQDRLTCEYMPAESLSYGDETVDLVSGLWVLHHLDLNLAWREICRILRPGAKGVFVEPFGESVTLERL